MDRNLATQAAVQYGIHSAIAYTNARFRAYRQEKGETEVSPCASTYLRGDSEPAGLGIPVSISSRGADNPVASEQIPVRGVAGYRLRFARLEVGSLRFKTATATAKLSGVAFHLTLLFCRSRVS